MDIVERTCWFYFLLGASLLLAGYLIGEPIIGAAGGGFMVGGGVHLINWK
jgi:hypothetical protein